MLAAGEVVTVEPGIYLPGELGVRIEDLVVVTDDGHRNLSGLPKELEIVARRGTAAAVLRALRLQFLSPRRSAADRTSTVIATASREPLESLAEIRDSARKERLIDMELRAAPLPRGLLRDPRRRAWSRSPRSSAGGGWRRWRSASPGFAVADRFMRASAHPAIWVGAAWGLIPLLLAGAVVVDRGRRQPRADVVRAAGGHPRRPLRAARDRDRSRRRR